MLELDMELKILFPKCFDIGHSMVCLVLLFIDLLISCRCIGGVFLLGGTNAGKSSLFNTLVDSDLCHIHALDCIQRATVSNLPGRVYFENFLISDCILQVRQ